MKKPRKDYDYYTLNIPNELRILFEAYIAKFPNLGFKSISQYLLHVLQMRAEEIIKSNPDLSKIEEIRKLIKNKERLLEKIDQMWGETPSEDKKANRNI